MNCTYCSPTYTLLYKCSPNIYYCPNCLRTSKQSITSKDYNDKLGRDTPTRLSEDFYKNGFQ